MSVLFSKDDKKSEMIVTCRCGCDDAAHFTIWTDGDCEMYSMISYMNGNFYSDQTKTVWKVVHDKFKRIWAIVRNKDYYYSDIVMDKDEWVKFKEFVNSID